MIQKKDPQLKIQIFSGEEASVNSYLIMNESSVGIIDALRNREEAKKLAETVRATGRRPVWLYITHGHPDHYIGARTLKEFFPEIRIYVATEAIKQDIIGFSAWMDSVGWLDRQPQMKVLSEKNKDGFDYLKNIEVLSPAGLALSDGVVLEIRSDFPATECGHISTLYCRELNSLFVSDICYQGVHAWAGQGVEIEHIQNWLQVLGDLKADLIGSGVAIYPGHGKPGGVERFDEMRLYLLDFLASVRGEKTNSAALERLKRIYPAHQQAAFLLHYSVDYHGPDKRRT
jgi:glyoxylase-like metal-dependent hydrolase (beta-lactamase superfamily II)